MTEIFLKRQSHRTTDAKNYWQKDDGQTSLLVSRALGTAQEDPLEPGLADTGRDDVSATIFLPLLCAVARRATVPGSEQSGRLQKCSQQAEIIEDANDF